MVKPVRLRKPLELRPYLPLNLAESATEYNVSVTIDIALLIVVL
jgi:hypothetical protein